MKGDNGNTFLTKDQHKALNMVQKSPISIKLGSNQYVIGIYRYLVKRESVAIEGIYREGLIELINSLGYFKRYQPDNSYQYIYEENNIIEIVSIAQIRDAVNEIVQQSKEIKFEYKGLVFEATANMQKDIFLRNSPSIFNDSILGHLSNHSAPILHDTETEAFFAFKNCIYKVTQNGIEKQEYSSLHNVCVWKDHLIKRSCDYVSDFYDAQFAEFVSNVSNSEHDRISAFFSAIGYLLHNYSNPTTSRAVIAYDEQLTGKNEPSGGSGKGLFNQGINQLRNVTTIDGKKINDKNQFSYQLVTQLTQVISFDDVRHDYDFLTLNSNLTTGWQIEQKNKPSFRFEPYDNPKTYITSNVILKAEGTTAARRQFILEFSPYYSNLVKQNIEPIIHVHGNTFFSDEWSQAEWNKFFSFMLHCVTLYIKEGLHFYKLISVNQNKLLQLTSDDFCDWITNKDIEQDIEFNLTSWFADFKVQYYGIDNDFKQRTFTNWLKTYALTNNWQLSTKRSNGETKAKFIKK